MVSPGSFPGILHCFRQLPGTPGEADESAPDRLCVWCVCMCMRACACGYVCASVRACLCAFAMIKQGSRVEHMKIDFLTKLIQLDTSLILIF